MLAYDANIDLAVCKINATGLDFATICKKPVNVGETVYAIGSSRGMTNTYSQGIITYANRVVDNVSHIQHDASITNGNSGGPLINIYGEVIGINTWGISNSQNLNFAVFTKELDNLSYSSPISFADFYSYHSPSFIWVEDETGFIVTATFTLGGKKETIKTYVPSNDYTMYESEDSTNISFAFTASVVFKGVVYTDTRYIKYTWQTIKLHNSNYKDYLNVNCSMGGWDILTSVTKIYPDAVYSNVVVTFNVTVTGQYVKNGYDGLYYYRKTFKINNQLASQQYTDIPETVYTPSVTYSVSVSGQVSNYVMTDYLVP